VIELLLILRVSFPIFSFSFLSLDEKENKKKGDRQKIEIREHQNFVSEGKTAAQSAGTGARMRCEERRAPLSKLSRVLKNGDTNIRYIPLFF